MFVLGQSQIFLVEKEKVFCLGFFFLYNLGKKKVSILGEPKLIYFSIPAAIPKKSITAAQSYTKTVRESVATAQFSLQVHYSRTL